MNKLTVTLALISMIGAFSIDTYFPSFPAIGAHFGVSQAEVQQTLSCYLIGLAFMSLFHGSLSDSFGRRRVILTALIVYTLTCFGSVFAPSFGWLIFFRSINGLTGGAGFIITQAIVRDVMQGASAQKLLAKIMMLFAAAPAIAPVIGGYLHIWFGWQGPFMFLTLLGLCLTILVYFNLPETLPPEQRHRFHPVTLGHNYLHIFKSGRFFLYALSSALSFAGVITYVTGAPDFVMNILGLKETQFGWLFIPFVTGLIGGSFLSHQLADRMSRERIIWLAYGIMFTAGILNLLYNIFFTPGMPWAILPLPLYVLGQAIISPALSLNALDIFPEKKGMAASLASFVTLVVFAAVSAFVAPFVHGVALRYAGVMMILLILNLAAYLYSRKLIKV